MDIASQQQGEGILYKDRRRFKVQTQGGWGQRLKGVADEGEMWLGLLWNRPPPWQPIVSAGNKHVPK